MFFILQFLSFGIISKSVISKISRCHSTISVHLLLNKILAKLEKSNFLLKASKFANIKQFTEAGEDIKIAARITNGKNPDQIANFGAVWAQLFKV